jgi:hypothetical protein
LVVVRRSTRLRADWLRRVLLQLAKVLLQLVLQQLLLLLLLLLLQQQLVLQLLLLLLLQLLQLVVGRRQRLVQARCRRPRAAGAPQQRGSGVWSIHAQRLLQNGHTPLQHRHHRQQLC